MPVQPDVAPSDPRPTGASRARIWSPFIVGSIGGTIGIILEAQIGEFLGVYSPLLGYLAANLCVGAAIGFVAALASRTWTGLLTLILGLVTAGVAVGVFAVLTAVLEPGDLVSFAFYLAFVLGVFGVPTYAIVTGVAYLIRWMARPAPPPEGPA